MDDQRLDAIVASFYEAAIEPTAWRDALHALASSPSADNFHLMVWDPRLPRPLHSQTWGMDPSVEAAYQDHFGAIDPRRLLAAKLPDGEWLACHRHFDDRAVARDGFFQDIGSGQRHFRVLMRASSSGLLSPRDRR